MKNLTLTVNKCSECSMVLAPSFQEKIKDADDGNRSEIEQEVEYSQQTDSETEESEELEENENV